MEHANHGLCAVNENIVRTIARICLVVLLAQRDKAVDLTSKVNWGYCYDYSGALC